MTSRPNGPSPAELWRQAGGNPTEYVRLLGEHGHLVPDPPHLLPYDWTPGERSTATPVPSINPPPGPVEVEARALHAATCRMETPDVTDRDILDAWDDLPDDGRQWLLDTARKRIEARTTEPDDAEAPATFKVAKWGHAVPLADGVCHCGQPIKYNLWEGVVAHADPGANAVCAEPWPDVPAPERYAASRAIAAVLKRGSEALDRAFGLEPHHAAARQRTSTEQATIEARTCCGDAAAGPDDDGVVLHTGGCRNRCAVDVPCLDHDGRPGTYPCGATVGHRGDCWVPPAVRPKAVAR